MWEEDTYIDTLSSFILLPMFTSLFGTMWQWLGEHFPINSSFHPTFHETHSTAWFSVSTTQKKSFSFSYIWQDTILRAVRASKAQQVTNVQSNAKPYKWTYASAFLYSLTLITTIGKFSVYSCVCFFFIWVEFRCGKIDKLNHETGKQIEWSIWEWTSCQFYSNIHFVEYTK